jgi:hypothetical protein
MLATLEMNAELGGSNSPNVHFLVLELSLGPQV